jgi:HD superfamily phosphohydrolase
MTSDRSGVCGNISRNGDLMPIDTHNTQIRDNMDGNPVIEFTAAIRKVIDAREFQRLRNIRQMGVASYVFPTAEHSRFAHSLGVYSRAKQLFRQLKEQHSKLGPQIAGFRFDDCSEIEFSVAALCHDVGHTAYSHVLETMLLPDGIRNHEDCAVALLEGESQISKAIGDVADLGAVRCLLDKCHPSNPLSDLISGTLDVDRCDYVLRDAQMCGVEYGKFDLQSLLGAVTLGTNQNRQPVLLLDGSCGMEALRQFLSARRYMHRHVYLHSTVRGAQILLRGIFSRMRDLATHKDTLSLAPACLHSIASGHKLSMSDFVRTTDVEVMYMVRSFASDHSDRVLSYLANLFVSRSFPKCVFDFRSDGPTSKGNYSNETGSSAVVIPAETGSIIEDLRLFVADKLQKSSLPFDAAKYLVSFDSIGFSANPTDLLISLPDEIVSVAKIDSNCAGFDLTALLAPFSIRRLFVPRELAAVAREYVFNKYAAKLPH